MSEKDSTPKHKKEKRGIKGTDIYLAIICILVIWYVWFSALTYERTGAWMPTEITIGVWILALYEVFALLRVQMVKQGEHDKHGIISGTYNAVRNWINSKSPIELPDTELDVVIAKEQMEDPNEKTIKS